MTTALLLKAAVFALCLIARYAGAHVRQDFDIEKWVRWSGEPQRFWNREMLSGATVLPGYRQLHPFIHKLNSGANVTVVAFGTSITSDGGCFNSDLVSGLVAVPPYAHLRCILTPGNTGWLHRFMTHINTTWPAAGHALVNVGMPGSTLYSRAVGSCLEVSLPHTADLVIIENLAGLDGGGHFSGTMLEVLIRRLAHHFPQAPPVILLHTVPIAPPWSQTDHCIRDNNCTQLCANNFTHSITAEGDFARGHEGVLNLVAEYYGYSSLSLRNFYHGILRDGIPDASSTAGHTLNPSGTAGHTPDPSSTAGRTLNPNGTAGLPPPPSDAPGQALDASHAARGHWTAATSSISRDAWFCQLVTAVQQDSIHPRHGLGWQLLADLLINHLVEAEARLQQHGGMPLPVKLPRRPLHPAARDTYVYRCYGRIEDSGHNEATLNGGSDVMAPMETPVTTGWEWVTYQVHGEVKKLKPGWTALAPGAVLQLVVNTSFRKAVQPLVGVTYLCSYEHMGMAHVSCVSGCECNSFVLDAHKAEHKVSLLTTAEFNVTQAARCTVQLETLSNTTSGEFKFKVARIYVKAAVGSGDLDNATRWL